MWVSLSGILKLCTVTKIKKCTTCVQAISFTPSNVEQNVDCMNSAFIFRFAGDVKVVRFVGLKICSRNVDVMNHTRNLFSWET
jgi:hypothetical protein